jgi:hypothetical protein
MIEFHWVEVIGYAGTLATIATYSMRTILPLRVAGIFSSLFYIAYGSILGAWPIVATELVILPLNCFRLYQILRLMQQIREAPATGENLPEWLYPFATMRRHKAGEVIFRRGDHAEHLLLVQSGCYRLIENGAEMTSGKIVGELGFVSPGNLRTMTLQCIEDGVAGEISYDHIKQLYYQNPKFGYFFLQLIGSHLVEKLQYPMPQPTTAPSGHAIGLSADRRIATRCGSALDVRAQEA